VYVGDQDHPYNVFEFTLGRSRDGPAGFLKGYRGTLMADAYGGYDGVVVGNDLTRAGCWAHARRKFVDAEPTHPAIAAEAVGIIKRLYAVEERGQDLDARARRTLRQSESVPILAALREKLFTWRDQLLPKRPMAQAVAYTLNQWDELSVFAGDGAVPNHRRLQQMLSQIILRRFCPALNDVIPQDTDPDMYRRIEIIRAAARGDFETAERLRAELPRRPTIDLSQYTTPHEQMVAFNKYQDEIAMPAHMRACAAQDTAVAAAKRRLAGAGHRPGPSTPPQPAKRRARGEPER
jgi:hypothetical protein